MTAFQRDRLRLAAPFTEVASIFRSQALRFAIEFVSAALVITSICLGGLSHWDPLKTIWIMSAAGAGSSLLGLTLLWSRLRAMIDRAAVRRGTSVASESH